MAPPVNRALRLWLAVLLVASCGCVGVSAREFDAYKADLRTHMDALEETTDTARIRARTFQRLLEAGVPASELRAAAKAHSDALDAQAEAVAKVKAALR